MPRGRPGPMRTAPGANYSVGVSDAPRSNGHRRPPSIAVVGGGFGGVGAVTMLRRAGYENVTVFERGERDRRRLAPQHLPRRRLRRPLAPLRVLLRSQPAVVAPLRAPGRDPGLPRGRRAPPRRAGADPHVDRGARGALGRRARHVGAADERGPARGRRPAHRLRPALGAHGAADPRPRQLRGSRLPHRALAPRRRPRGPAGGGGRHRLQRDPGGARHPADRRAASTSTSARRAGRSRRWTIAYSERAQRLFARFPVLQRMDRAAIFAFMELGAAAMTSKRWLLPPARALARRQITKAIDDPELRRQGDPARRGRAASGSCSPTSGIRR